MKLSIIIPAYNASQYINRCLQSIVHQNISEDEYEIIIVNDGSTDDTVDKIRPWLKYTNLRLITQENCGSSIARNRGIDEAVGVYLWFIDADDYIRPDCVYSLIEIAENNDLDILLFELTKLNANGAEIFQTCCQKSLPHDVAITGRQAILDGYNPCSACACLYKRKYLDENSLRFYPRIYHQDVQFNYRAVSLASRVMFITESPYLYCTNEDSVTTSVRPEKVIKNKIDDLIVAESFRAFANERFKNDSDLFSEIMLRSSAIEFGIALQVFNCKRKGNKSVAAPLISEMRRRGILPMHSHRSIRHAVFSEIFNLYLR